ncbi:zinc finger protein RFP-like [Notechis scutatus]|uniref:Zinc finger protein RFP-like n=1 Tax=Notechis scutatus TaxID=8663 RepID=A0A6J1VJW0_9SAUR|nr:zinc finger protein RFP-like [Notechis scutatus]
MATADAAGAAASLLTSTVCEVHNKPLEFFCQNELALICTQCAKSKKHHTHTVLSIQEAAQKNKAEIQSHVKKGREVARMYEKHVEMSTQNLWKKPGEERRKLVREFEQFHQAVKDQMQFLLSHLEELKINILDYQKKNHARHTANTIELNTLIGDIERKCDQPEAEFLKQMTQVNSLVSNLEKLRKQLPEECLKEFKIISNCLGEEKYMENNLGDLEQRLEKITEQNKVLKETLKALKAKIQIEVIKIMDNCLKSYEKANVFFDRDTLSHMLVLSSDQITVKWNGELKEKTPYHWMRFEKDACVLGSEGFASGRIYWEINVEEGKIWAVGVAKESVERKHLIKFAPENGIWGLGLDEQKKYMAYTNSGVAPLDLSEPLRKIRVQLDYTAGQVSFFNAGTNGWIFTFPPANFSGENIYPWFWVKGGLLKLPAIDFEELAADLVWGRYSEVPLYGDPWEFFNEPW